MSNLINSINIVNAGPTRFFSFKDPTRINLLIGGNGSGKTFLLKMLYSAIRTIETFHRGDDIRSITDILSDKLRWTLQTDRIGELVRRGVSEPLFFEFNLEDQHFSYSFSPSASVKIKNVELIKKGRAANSIFLPAKEVLSIFSVIKKSREIDLSFGFDDTYYDLVKALSFDPMRENNNSALLKSQKVLREIIKGKIDFDKNSMRWFYKDNNNCKYSIGVVSDGIKKISIFDRLLVNGYLNNNSIVFIDEIESSLQPNTICKFLDIVDDISEHMGVLFFITTHSQLTLKKLYLVAKKRKGTVTCISLNNNHSIDICDLYYGIPENGIIDIVADLYNNETEGEFEHEKLITEIAKNSY